MIDSVRETFQTLKFISETRGVKTIVEVKPKHMKFFEAVYGDSNRFQQILLNFISNSLKFTRREGFVKVEIGISKVVSTKNIEQDSGETISLDEMSFNRSSNDYVIKVDPTSHNRRILVGKDKFKRTSSINDLI